MKKSHLNKVVALLTTGVFIFTSVVPVSFAEETIQRDPTKKFEILKPVEKVEISTPMDFASGGLFSAFNALSKPFKKMDVLKPAKVETTFESFDMMDMMPSFDVMETFAVEDVLNDFASMEIVAPLTEVFTPVMDETFAMPEMDVFNLTQMDVMDSYMEMETYEVFDPLETFDVFDDAVFSLQPFSSTEEMSMDDLFYGEDLGFNYPEVMEVSEVATMGSPFEFLYEDFYDENDDFGADFYNEVEEALKGDFSVELDDIDHDANIDEHKLANVESEDVSDSNKQTKELPGLSEFLKDLEHEINSDAAEKDINNDGIIDDMDVASENDVQIDGVIDEIESRIMDEMGLNNIMGIRAIDPKLNDLKEVRQGIEAFKKELSSFLAKEDKEMIKEKIAKYEKDLKKYKEELEAGPFGDPERYELLRVLIDLIEVVIAELKAKLKEGEKSGADNEKVSTIKETVNAPLAKDDKEAIKGKMIEMNKTLSNPGTIAGGPAAGGILPMPPYGGPLTEYERLIQEQLRWEAACAAKQPGACAELQRLEDEWPEDLSKLMEQTNPEGAGDPTNSPNPVNPGPPVSEGELTEVEKEIQERLRLRQACALGWPGTCAEYERRQRIPLPYATTSKLEADGDDNPTAAETKGDWIRITSELDNNFQAEEQTEFMQQVVEKKSAPVKVEVDTLLEAGDKESIEKKIAELEADIKDAMERMGDPNLDEIEKELLYLLIEVAKEAIARLKEKLSESDSSKTEILSDVVGNAINFGDGEETPEPDPRPIPEPWPSPKGELESSPISNLLSEVIEVTEDFDKPMKEPKEGFAKIGDDMKADARDKIKEALEDLLIEGEKGLLDALNHGSKRAREKVRQKLIELYGKEEAERILKDAGDIEVRTVFVRDEKGDVIYTPKDEIPEDKNGSGYVDGPNGDLINITDKGGRVEVEVRDKGAMVAGPGGMNGKPAAGAPNGEMRDDEGRLIDDFDNQLQWHDVQEQMEFEKGIGMNENPKPLPKEEDDWVRVVSHLDNDFQSDPETKYRSQLIEGRESQGRGGETPPPVEENKEKPLPPKIIGDWIMISTDLDNDFQSDSQSEYMQQLVEKKSSPVRASVNVLLAKDDEEAIKKQIVELEKDIEEAMKRREDPSLDEIEKELLYLLIEVAKEMIERLKEKLNGDESSKTGFSEDTNSSVSLGDGEEVLNEFVASVMPESEASDSKETEAYEDMMERYMDPEENWSEAESPTDPEASETMTREWRLKNVIAECTPETCTGATSSWELFGSDGGVVNTGNLAGYNTANGYEALSGIHNLLPGEYEAKVKTKLPNGKEIEISYPVVIPGFDDEEESDEEFEEEEVSEPIEGDSDDESSMDDVISDEGSELLPMKKEGGLFEIPKGGKCSPGAFIDGKDHTTCEGDGEVEKETEKEKEDEGDPHEEERKRIEEEERKREEEIRRKHEEELKRKEEERKRIEEEERKREEEIRRKHEEELKRKEEERKRIEEEERKKEEEIRKKHEEELKRKEEERKRIEEEERKKQEEEMRRRQELEERKLVESEEANNAMASYDIDEMEKHREKMGSHVEELEKNRDSLPADSDERGRVEEEIFHIKSLMSEMDDTLESAKEEKAWEEVEEKKKKETEEVDVVMSSYDIGEMEAHRAKLKVLVSDLLAEQKKHKPDSKEWEYLQDQIDHINEIIKELDEAIAGAKEEKAWEEVEEKKKKETEEVDVVMSSYDIGEMEAHRAKLKVLVSDLLAEQKKHKPDSKEWEYLQDQIDHINEIIKELDEAIAGAKEEKAWEEVEGKKKKETEEVDVVMSSYDIGEMEAHRAKLKVLVSDLLAEQKKHKPDSKEWEYLQDQIDHINEIIKELDEAIAGAKEEKAWEEVEEKKKKETEEVDVVMSSYDIGEMEAHRAKLKVLVSDLLAEQKKHKPDSKEWEYLQDQIDHINEIIKELDEAIAGAKEDAEIEASMMMKDMSSEEDTSVEAVVEEIPSTEELEESFIEDDGMSAIEEDMSSWDSGDSLDDEAMAMMQEILDEENQNEVSADLVTLSDSPEDIEAWKASIIKEYAADDYKVSFVERPEPNTVKQKNIEDAWMTEKYDEGYDLIYGKGTSYGVVVWALGHSFLEGDKEIDGYEEMSPEDAEEIYEDEFMTMTPKMIDEEFSDMGTDPMDFV